MSTETKIEPTTKTSHYPMYKVIMHNDPITTMDFVIGILMRIYIMDLIKATTTMLEIHTTDIGLAGIYALEHAELKVEQTHSLARTQGFPLTCTIEST